MKTKITLMCAVVVSMAVVEAGYGIPAPFVSSDAGESRTAANSGPILLASNVEFQRKVQTQTTLIQHEASERRRKIPQKHAAADVEQKKEMKKRVR